MNRFSKFFKYLRRQWKLACGHNEYLAVQQRRLMINADVVRRTLNRKTPRRIRKHNRALYKKMMLKIDELETRKI